MSKYATQKPNETRPYLTVPDAANHLSGIGIGDGTEAYVLSLVLHRKLRLSVFFSKESWANPCSTGNNFLNVDESTWVSLTGLWDLPMIDGGEFEIEQRWRKLTNNPESEARGVHWVFLEDDNGLIYRLKNSFNFSEYQAETNRMLKEQRRQNAINNVCKENADLLLNLIGEERENFLSNRLRFPGFSLPKDSVLVIRTKALLEYEYEVMNSVAGQTGSKTSAAQSKNERNTMLKLIYGMAVDAYDYDPKNPKNTATGGKSSGISQKLQIRGVEISNDTVKKYLDEAKVLIEEQKK
jgi:hypothetical protein